MATSANFARFSARTAWVKKLSSKQDNEKNQIYLGGGLDGVTNLVPATLHARSPSKSIAKRGAKPGGPPTR